MKVTFILSTGTNITADIADFDSAEFAKTLNSPQTLFISVGDNGFQKHSLIGWNKVPSETV